MAWTTRPTRRPPRGRIAERGRAAALLGAAVMLWTGGSVGHAEDIAPFRFTGVDGYASLRYLRDSYATGAGGAASGGNARSRQTQSELREELFLMTHSYVYHPNFLSLDIGGGPILQQGAFANEAGDTRSRDALYNLSARATLLRDKPYRGSLFFEHLNPTVSIAPGQVMGQENTRYGFDLALLAPLTAVPLFVDATRSHFRGRGVDRIVDDRIDRFNLRASHSFGALGATQFQYQATRQDSMSGSPNLPVQATSQRSDGLNLDSRFQFGSRREYELVNQVAASRQAYALGASALPDRKDLRFLLDLRGRHSDALQSFAYTNFSSSDQGELRSETRSASAGLSYSPRPELATTFALRADDNRNREFLARSAGMDGSLRYERPLPVGSAQLSYALRRERHAQDASAPQTGVIGERLTLAGTAVVSLAQLRVISGSVVVSNAARTQTFAEGLDYVLSTVGLQTRVQRLVGGNIVDGQEVLVDYSYDVGGTFAYVQTDHTLNLNWSVSRGANLFLRVFNSTPRLTSGAPTFPLNTVRSTLHGARADLPLKWPGEAVLGGGLEWEKRQETVSPYRRATYDVYLQAEDPLFGAGNVRIAARRMRLDYEKSTQNVNLLGYDVGYWSRHWSGVDLSADASYERDIGGWIPRRRLAASLKAQWRFRKLSLTVDLGRSRESQGDFERTRSLVQFLVRRDLEP